MARGRSFNIDVEGIHAAVAGMARFEHSLPIAVRSALRGPGGEALASQMRMRETSRSGLLKRNTKVWEAEAAGGDVLIGYRGGLTGGGGNHGNAVSGAREQRGAWFESGTQPHLIKARPGGALNINGTEVSQVEHPGARAHKVVPKALRSAQWEVESAIIDELDLMNGGRFA